MSGDAHVCLGEPGCHVIWRDHSTGLLRGVCRAGVPCSEEDVLAAPAPRDPLLYAHTDMGNAERMRDQLGGRFVWTGLEWREWTGNHWEQCRRAAESLHWAAAESARSLRSAAQATDNAAAVRWSVWAESASGIAAAAKILKTMPDVFVAPHQFDRDPYLLNCPSGTVDLRTGEQRESRRSDYITFVTGASYAPGKDYGTYWPDLVARCHPSQPEVAGYLQRVQGYAASGLTVEQMFVLHLGAGGNGKGLFVHGVTEAMGSYAKTARISAFLAGRDASAEGATPAMAGLAGVRLVFAEEADVTARLDEGKLKNLTGQGLVSARRLYQEESQFRPAFQLQLLTNHTPAVWGRDEGIWRRIRLVNWHESFGSNADNGIYQEVTERRDEVLAWIIQGAVEYFQGGLRTPPAVLRAVEAYRDENDRLAGWCPGKWVADAGVWTPRAEVGCDYAAWVSDEFGPDAKAMPPQALYNALRGLGIAVRRVRTGYELGMRRASKAEERGEVVTLSPPLSPLSEPLTCEGDKVISGDKENKESVYRNAIVENSRDSVMSPSPCHQTDPLLSVYAQEDSR